MHAVFPAVMKELNGDKHPLSLTFTDSWAVASGLAIWSGRRAVETWPVKGMSVCCIALWQSLKKFEGYIKEDPVGAQIWKGTGADEKNLPMCSLKVATCAH